MNADRPMSHRGPARRDRLGLRRRAMLRARQVVDLGPPRLSLAIASAFERRAGEPELALLPALVRMGGVAIDAGANRGVYTSRLARLCRLVIACEPQPRLARRLAVATPDNVRVLPAALSSTSGEARFHVPMVGAIAVHTRGSLASAGDAVPADITVIRLRLDDLALDDVGFLKLDVEGHELPALEGASVTLERSRPRLLVECDVSSGTSPAKVADHLAPLGYEGWFHIGGRMLPLDHFRAEVHQASSKQVGGRLPADRVTNFLFLPHDEAVSVVGAVRSLLASR